MTADEFNKAFSDFKAQTQAFMTAATPFRSGRMISEITHNDTPTGFGMAWSTPYTVYTIEKWLSPKWRGRTNPNENWLLEAVNARLDIFVASKGGRRL